MQRVSSGLLSFLLLVIDDASVCGSFKMMLRGTIPDPVVPVVARLLDGANVWLLQNDAARSEP